MQLQFDTMRVHPRMLGIFVPFLILTYDNYFHCYVPLDFYEDFIPRFQLHVYICKLLNMFLVIYIYILVYSFESLTVLQMH